MWKMGFSAASSSTSNRRNTTLMAAFYFCLFYYLALNFPVASALPFKCSSKSNCTALVDYLLPNTTTISAVQKLFSVPDLYSILGVNSLPVDTKSNYSLPANSTLTIPIPCLCTNGTGISNGVPVYTVVPQDGLFHIATDVFSGLVTFPEIQSVNNITNSSMIFPGQKLWIPLPCSCDDEDGRKVVHYGLRVAAGSTLAGIAETYNTSQDTLLSLNGLASPKELLADAILDVPLTACVSPVTNNSIDYPLLLTNGTYAVTAGDCVICHCDASNNFTLKCNPSQLNSSIWKSCPNLNCNTGTLGNISLGNSTNVDCNRTTCTYTGYNNKTIFSQPISDSICPAPTGTPPSPPAKSSSWMISQRQKLDVVLFISLVFLLLCS